MLRSACVATILACSGPAPAPRPAEERRAPDRIPPHDWGEVVISGRVERFGGSPAVGFGVRLEITAELALTERSGECSGDPWAPVMVTTQRDGTFEHRIPGGGPSFWLCVRAQAIAPGGSESSDAVRTRLFYGAEDLGPKTADLRLVLRPRVSSRCVPIDTAGYRSSSARLVDGTFTREDGECYVLLRGESAKREYECGKVVVMLEDGPARVEALADAMHARILRAAATGCFLRVYYRVDPHAIRQALEAAYASAGVFSVDVNYFATIEMDEESQVVVRRDRGGAGPREHLAHARHQRDGTLRVPHLPGGASDRGGRLEGNGCDSGRDLQLSPLYELQWIRRERR